MAEIFNNDLTAPVAGTRHKPAISSLGLWREQSSLSAVFAPACQTQAKHQRNQCPGR